jgi:tRNA nucleotidyltransferase (CCA-adding enzyme)
MEIYLVGGAVRDELLGRPVRERDWVVVGSTPEELLSAGYRQVGRDFPVFLHPDSSEEYALARTERKSGPGHTGFVVHADADVTLEEDLVRRDLTINAMARAADGTLIDPFRGRRDLEARLLRHVSPAFAEDPLRIFRVARFAAELPGFEVAPETLELMRQMAAENALDELSAERVWAELYKALAGNAPERFFQVLTDASCLAPWFAELAGASVPLTTPLPDSLQRFAAIVGPLGKPAVESLCERLKAPRAAQRLAALVAEHGLTLAHWREQEAADVYQALLAARAFKKDSALPVLAAVLELLYSVQLGDLRTLAAAIAADISAAAFVAEGYEGAALGAALDSARVASIEQALNQSELP